MEKSSFLKEKFDVVLLGLHIINVLFVFLISLGLLDGSSIVSYYLVLSIAIIIPGLSFLKWKCMKDGNENKVVFEYLPFLSMALIELIIGVKICLQLISEAHWMAITVFLTFMLLCFVLSLIYNDKCKGDIKKKGVCYLVNYISFLVFMFANFILILDWWYL